MCENNTQIFMWAQTHNRDQAENLFVVIPRNDYCRLETTIVG